MNDLEMTRLCAEAMGFNPIEDGSGGIGINHKLEPAVGEYTNAWEDYDPIHDDAQAMALVKRFRLDIYSFYADDDDGKRWASCTEDGNVHNEIGNINLNRAIVECVATMQSKKG